MMTTRTNRTSRMLALAAGTALASVTLTGCTTKAAPRADFSASKAEAALAQGKTSQAIASADSLELVRVEGCARPLLCHSAVQRFSR